MLYDCSKVRLHYCSVCGKYDPWGLAWSWFGSEIGIENGEEIIKVCSDECRANAKIIGLVPKNASIEK